MTELTTSMKIGILVLCISVLGFSLTTVFYHKAYLGEKEAKEFFGTEMLKCKESECANFATGLFRESLWKCMDGWTKTCNEEGKIFTYAVGEQGMWGGAKCE